MLNIREIDSSDNNSNSYIKNQNEILDLQNLIQNWNIKANKIKSSFDFIVPNYIIDEIIENENYKNYENLHYLLNCAVINHKLSQENAFKIKEIYC